MKTILAIVRSPTATLATMMAVMRMTARRMKMISKTTIATMARSVMELQIPAMCIVHTTNRTTLIHISIVADDAVKININTHNNGSVVATTNMTRPALIFETRT